MQNSVEPHQLIWIYTVFNSGAYPGSAGPGLTQKKKKKKKKKNTH